jgi:protein-tyrosine-phosphatase
MAEVLAGAIRPELYCESAGLSAARGTPAAWPAREAMRDRGLLLDDHRAQAIRDLDLGRFDHVVALTPSMARTLTLNHGCPAAKLRIWDIADPFGHDLITYRNTACDIVTALRDDLP